MKKHILSSLLLPAVALVLTACPRPLPPDPPEPPEMPGYAIADSTAVAGPLQPDRNDYTHQYNTAQSLMGKTRAEAVAILEAEGFEEDSLNAGVYVMQLTEDDDITRLNVEFKASATDRIYFVASNAYYHGALRDSNRGIKTANTLPEALGEVISIADGCLLRYHNVVTYNIPKSTAYYDDMLKLIDGIDFWSGYAYYDNIGYLAQWGEGEVKRCEIPSDLYAEAQAGNISTFIFRFVEGESVDKDITETISGMIFADKALAQ